MKQLFFYFPGCSATIKLMLQFTLSLSKGTLVRLVILLGISQITLLTQAQLNTDNAYRKPLKEVLSGIEKRYGVKINYADSMVANKTVAYADWRFRNDVEETLDNVLKPLDMKVREEKD